MATVQPLQLMLEPAVAASRLGDRHFRRGRL
jgi:hypothetical protein